MASNLWNVSVSRKKSQYGWNKYLIPWKVLKKFLFTRHQVVTHLFLMEQVFFLHSRFRCNLQPQSTSTIITFSFPPISLLSCARLCGYHQLVCAACREIVVSAIMPPKKKAANEPSKKTDQKKKEKIIEVFESLIIFSDNTARLLSTYICDLCPL